MTHRSGYAVVRREDGTAQLFPWAYDGTWLQVREGAEILHAAPVRHLVTQEAIRQHGIAFERGGERFSIAPEEAMRLVSECGVAIHASGWLPVRVPESTAG